LTRDKLAAKKTAMKAVEKESDDSQGEIEGRIAALPLYESDPDGCA